jgi:hypothetical protein
MHLTLRIKALEERIGRVETGIRELVAETLPAPFSVLYAMAASEQVPAERLAEWLRDPLFAAYSARQQSH